MADFAGVSQEIVAEIIAKLHTQGAQLSVAESLTGGMLGAAFVNFPGVSAVFAGGVISYTYAMKQQLLGVDRHLLETGGAVQAQVARQMAQGVAQLCGTEYALATTGVAGPGSADGHPQGTVFIGVKTPQLLEAKRFSFIGSRTEIRQQSVMAAINLLAQALAVLPAENDRISENWEINAANNTSGQRK